MNSVLAEYKVLQKKAFEINDKESEEYLDISERMDVLWIRLSAEEEEEVRQYWRKFFIEESS